MTDICELHRDRIAAAFGRLVASGRLPAVPPSERIVVEPTRDPAHGDLATGVAMTLGKAFGMPPSAIAAALADELAADPGVVSAAVAGPGFVNVALAPEAFGDAVRSAVSSGAAYGRRPPDGTPPMVVEFVSANPTGPMHVGHGRGAVVGDALASLLAFAGRTVSREYYVNDAGAQVDVLARSVFVRYLARLIHRAVVCGVFWADGARDRASVLTRVDLDRSVSTGGTGAGLWGHHGPLV